MEEYINHLKDMMDTTIEDGDELSLKDQVMYALGGLGFYYMSLITNITLSKQVPQIEEVFTTIIAQEKKLKKMNISTSNNAFFKFISLDFSITHLLASTHLNLYLLFNKDLVHKLHFLILHLTHKISDQEVMFHHKISGQKDSDNGY